MVNIYIFQLRIVLHNLTTFALMRRLTKDAQGKITATGMAIHK